jgi:hypothetical protein
MDENSEENDNRNKWKTPDEDSNILKKTDRKKITPNDYSDARQA